ncbi:hypothetical protein [Actinokineospora terrae]|uniref:Uncharacterized protein n=1 Tax=Actinokineospora terrae TaxID=155974 RepID=A0A1H9WRI2_9PSEU|nr:hypothetical protein [Actinokineospora terrae]SES36542.1 hypothetical protein SAMN04487818_111131 [Actinokineospora terrae]
MTEHKDWRWTEVAIAVVFPGAVLGPVSRWLEFGLPGWVRGTADVVTVVFGVLVAAYLFSDRGYRAVIRRGRGVAGVVAPVVGVGAVAAFLVVMAYANVEEDFLEGQQMPQVWALAREVAMVGFVALLPVYVALRAIGGRGSVDESVE